MTKRDAVLETAKDDLREHLRDFCRHAPTYLKEYVTALLSDRTSTWTARAHFHPKLAEFVRELALDAAVMERRAGTLPSSAGVESGERDNDRPLTVKEYPMSMPVVASAQRVGSRGAVSPIPQNVTRGTSSKRSRTVVSRSGGPSREGV